MWTWILCLGRIRTNRMVRTDEDSPVLLSVSVAWTNRISGEAAFTSGPSSSWDRGHLGVRTLNELYLAERSEVRAVPQVSLWFWGGSPSGRSVTPPPAHPAPPAAPGAPYSSCYALPPAGDSGICRPDHHHSLCLCVQVCVDVCLYVCVSPVSGLVLFILTVTFSWILMMTKTNERSIKLQTPGHSVTRKTQSGL